MINDEHYIDALEHSPAGTEEVLEVVSRSINVSYTVIKNYGRQLSYLQSAHDRSNDRSVKDDISWTEAFKAQLKDNVAKGYIPNEILEVLN